MLIYWLCVCIGGQPADVLGWVNTLMIHGVVTLGFVTNFILQQHAFVAPLNLRRSCSRQDTVQEARLLTAQLQGATQHQAVPTWCRGWVNRNETLGMLMLFGAYIAATVIFNLATGDTPYVNKLDYRYHPRAAIALIFMAMAGYIVLTQLFSAAKRCLPCYNPCQLFSQYKVMKNLGDEGGGSSEVNTKRMIPGSRTGQ